MANLVFLIVLVNFPPYIAQCYDPKGDRHNRKVLKKTFWSVFSSSGRETADAVCPGNKPCLHNTKAVQFLKSSCQDFLNAGLKYQHLSPPSPEIDYIAIRVELREQATRALLEVQTNKPTNERMNEGVGTTREEFSWRETCREAVTLKCVDLEKNLWKVSRV